MAIHLTNDMAKSILKMLDQKSGSSVDIYKGDSWGYVFIGLSKFKSALFASKHDGADLTKIFISKFGRNSNTYEKQFLEKMLKFSEDGYDIKCLWQRTPFLKHGTCLEELLIEHDLLH